MDLSEVPAFHALVPAGGSGGRFGGGVPKQFLDLCGRPMVCHAIERLLGIGAESVVVAVPLETPDALRTRLTSIPRVRLVAGGATRQASVAAALAASPAGQEELVAVHDGARPATARDDLLSVLSAARLRGGAVLGRPIVDTVKEVADGRIVRTVDRARLFRAETPQVFRRSILEAALESARRDGFVGTDEASLIERLGDVDVVAVAAASPNPKITRPGDLEEVGRMLERSGGRLG